MTGGKASRQKGDRAERALVNLFQEHGLAAERIPLSGSAGGSFSGDLTIPVMGADWRFESKARANGFKQIYEWLGSNKGLCLHADRQPYLVVLRAEDFATLAYAARRDERSEGAFQRLLANGGFDGLTGKVP